MLHLRVLVPPTLTEPVRDLLLAEPGVMNLTVVAGAALDPVGDALEADVEHAALSDLIARLEALGVDRSGSFSLTELLEVRSEEADAPPSPGVGPDLISWDEVAARTRDDTVVTGAYLVLMTIAGVIAAGGILTSNALLIVGAMIVSPDYGPLAGFCVAAVGGPWQRARSSATALGVGFVVAAASAAVVAFVARSVDAVPEAYHLGERPVTELISNPNAASLVVALAAGVAGMVALGQSKSGAVVGVLVSVTTIPAVANVGVALALGNVDEALGAASQLLINVSGLVLAGVASLWIGRRIAHRRLATIVPLPARRGASPAALAGRRPTSAPPADRRHPAEDD